jgi:hypothetical protein
MSLTQDLATFNESIIDVISELLKTQAVTPDDFSDQMLDMREFSLDNRKDGYFLELLLDGYKICYINETIAYDSRGMQTSISYLIEEHLDALCEALDTLSGLENDD